MASEIDELNESIRDDPFDPWLYLERGWLYYGSGQYWLAITDFGKAIDLDPDEPAFWRSRGRLREILGHVSDAQNDLDRAVSLDPGDAESYYIRGWFYSLNHDNTAALADLDRAIDLEPLEPEFRYRRGMVWLEKGQVGKALEDFDEAIRLDPEESRYFYERAGVLLHEKNPAVNPEAALPDLEEAIRLMPDADYYRMSRGYIRFCQERWSDAAEDFACQDFRHQYRFCPYLGAEWVVWLDLTRRFEGKPALGLRAIREYLEWYLNEPVGRLQDQSHAEKLETWPVPLARFLAGDIDQQSLFNRKDLDATNPGLESCELDAIRDRIREFHFVLAECSLAAGLLDDAVMHLQKASGLPPQNPMCWVVASQLARDKSDSPTSDVKS